MNVVILSTPRSGSTYIARLLLNSPSLSTLMSEPFNLDYEEVVNDEYVDKCRRNLDAIKSHTDGLIIKDNLSYYSTKLYYGNEHIRQIVDEYHNYIDANFYKIKLLRNDIFEQALSNCFANSTDIWSFHKGDKMPVLEIDQSVLEITLDMYMDRHTHLLQFSNCHSTLYYEQLTNNVAADWKLLAPITPPKYYTVPETVPNPVKSAYISNYTDLQIWFETTSQKYKVHNHMQ